jgi:outer membrane protein OmpA-like peptidoglycan-associated protein
MALSRPALLASSLVLLLSGCGAAGLRIISADVDPGDFGAATMNNSLVMTGARDATYALQQRFAGEVESTITFAFNSAVLTPEARSVLDGQANWIRQFPELRFRVYGHTDLVGSDAYNKSLGKRRAEAVVAYFGSKGISRNRLEALVSYGETQPVVQTPGPEQRNRRTVTEVSGFYERVAGDMDGKYAEVVYRSYVESAHPVSNLTGFKSNSDNSSGGGSGSGSTSGGGSGDGGGGTGG